MKPFQIINARNQGIEEILRVNTGREKQQELVKQAILDSSHNVYIYGTRGSGKTFFQKTQHHHFSQLGENILPLYVPIQIHFVHPDFDATIFSLDLLNTIILECWNKFFDRPKSDLLRLSALYEHSALDDLKPKQKHYVSLYNILNAKHFNAQRKRASTYGASAVAKAENRKEESQTLSREQLLPSEIQVIVDEVSGLISESNIRRIIIHLDEIEFMNPRQRENLLSVCLGMFNPMGVQFIATGIPMDIDEGGYLLSNVETTIELEGLSTPTELGQMIAKYAENSIYSFEDESVAVLYEFFGGHPRTSLTCCRSAIEFSDDSDCPIKPRIMAKACLEAQGKIAAAHRAIAEQNNSG